jgi:hypothetical protein
VNENIPDFGMFSADDVCEKLKTAKLPAKSGH